MSLETVLRDSVTLEAGDLDPMTRERLEVFYRGLLRRKERLRAQPITDAHRWCEQWTTNQAMIAAAKTLLDSPSRAW